MTKRTGRPVMWLQATQNTSTTGPGVWTGRNTINKYLLMERRPHLHSSQIRVRMSGLLKDGQCQQCERQCVRVKEWVRNCQRGKKENRHLHRTRTQKKWFYKWVKTKATSEYYSSWLVVFRVTIHKRKTRTHTHTHFSSLIPAVSWQPLEQSIFRQAFVSAAKQSKI